MNPKVSVVLPVYNGKKYIRESIDSILAQSCLDWELILVDDCSVDGTAQILDEYSGSDSRITVIHNAVNQKLPRSLNIGFSKARGEYLTWTSDDNRYLPDALEKMADYLEGHSSAAVVRSDFYLIDEQGKRFEESQAYSDSAMYCYNCFGACFLYRRLVLEQVGEYDPNTFGVEDYDYWLRILERYGSIPSISEKLYEYRRHDESLSITRRQMIIGQLARLRERHQDEIFRRLKDQKAELCRMYYEMFPSEDFTKAFRERFRREIPELKGDMGAVERKPFMVFGAGVYGERAEKILGERAEFFVDNNPAKVGQRKCGRRILAFEEAKSKAAQYDFFIAVEGKHVYEMIRQLTEAGISEYTVFQSFTAEGRYSGKN